MRRTFIAALCEEAKKNKDIWLLTGDLGFGIVEPFEDQFSDRFINCGIMEQTMMGVAAGLALCGKCVFVYSIATFPTLRCLEQIRNDVVHHRANVKIVAYGAGDCYQMLGFSHRMDEDVAAMEAIGVYPVTPDTKEAVGRYTRNFCHEPGPAYLRLGKIDV